jgi:hypothetical protein
VVSLSLSRGLRLALVLSLGIPYVLVAHSGIAWADDDGDGGDDDGGGDDDDGGSKAKGDDDDGGSGDDGGGDDDGGDDKDQPLVTSGGLFTMRTYPTRENSRPLTMTEGIAQIRLSLGTDISAKGAFGSGGLSLEGIYGVKDNFSVLGGITDAYNFKQFGVYFGFEGALAYDLVDIRLAANIHRNAIPGYSNFCNPPGIPNETANNVNDCQNAAAGATLDTLPNGKFQAGGTKFSLDLGFPFRYSIRPEIAIVALQTLISIDFNSVTKDYVSVGANPDTADGAPKVIQTTKGNGAKPDLNPSIGIAANPIPQLSVVVFAQLRVPDFDTAAGAFQIPLTGRIEFSPNQKFDIGLEFTLLNLKPPEGQSPIDNRFLALFAQTRIGK